MDNLELYKLMRQVVLIATGVPKVIQANPNARAPSGEYCAILTEGSKRQRGQAIVKKTDIDTAVQYWESYYVDIGYYVGDFKDVQHDIRSQIIADVTCNFYRGKANDYAELLFQANKRPDIQELLFVNNVGWNGTNAINNLTALQSENWENRAQIVVRVTYEQTAIVTTNAIYQVPVTVEDFDSSVIISDITIISTYP